jgi:ABC-type glutathione transport system ATPase component
VATEYISEKKSKGEVLLFRRGHQPRRISDLESASISDDNDAKANDAGTLQAGSKIQRQTSIFHWQDVCYDIKIKGKPRRILDHVDGWVKPGTCTALMGVSGAGKTTLLDVLAARVNYYWGDACRRASSGWIISAEDRLRPTAGPSFTHVHCP